MGSSPSSQAKTATISEYEEYEVELMNAIRRTAFDTSIEEIKDVVDRRLSYREPEFDAEGVFV